MGTRHRGDSLSSPHSLKDANRLVVTRGRVIEAFTKEQSLLVIRNLLNHGTRTASGIAGDLRMPLSDVRMVLTRLEEAGIAYRADDAYALTEIARRRAGFPGISLGFLTGSEVGSDSSVDHSLPAYHVEEVIGKGATSFTFRARQISTHKERTLKVFLPGAVTYDRLDDAIRRRASIQRDAALPDVVDVGQIRATFPAGTSEILPCVTLKYIDGGARTFSEFLRSQTNLDSTIYERFVERVGGALAAIEEAGLRHGDLHEGNILVVPGKSLSVAREFWVIDFVGVPSVSSPELENLSDMDNFRDHLLQAALIGCQRYPGYSVRYLLGERVFRVLESLRRAKYETFGQLLDDYHRPATVVPTSYFSTPVPGPFEWLRVEWIPSAKWLYKLFEPVPSRFAVISRFGNTWISGPRGCGKSHYLRILQFQPQVIVQAKSDEALRESLKCLEYDFRKLFGVLFACRLGEFRGFVPGAMKSDSFDTATQEFLTHILVLKIWNKALNALREGLQTRDSLTGASVLQTPQDMNRLVDFLQSKIGSMAVVDESSPVSVFLQCLAICSAREISAISIWNQPEMRPQVHLLNESDLDEFFAVLRQTFPDLTDSQFCVLVDDASFGHFHFELQKVLNSLVRAVQKNHCFKITCDKFMYTLDTSEGRAIDPRHEVTYVDLGEVSTRSQRETAVNLSQHMARVIDLRLKAANYRFGIQDILGRSQAATEFLSALSLPGARRPRKSDRRSGKTKRARAYYGGWNIIWNLAHGSIRTLLEVIEHIFKSVGFSPDSTGISLSDQDKAVRSYANRQYKALSMLPGELDGNPIGGRLQAVISAVGEMSRQYLQNYGTGDKSRWYETISLERLDGTQLSPDARIVLNELVKYGLLLDEGTTFSRAQFGLCSRYDMNKIFAPAFQTTYRVRNHMYASRERFEELLLRPDAFVRRHREKLRLLASRGAARTIQPDLFEGDYGEG